MKRFLTIFFLFSIFIFLFFCRKPEKRIDVTTQIYVTAQDTIPLEITHVSPVGSVEGYRETFKILVGFNQPMVPLQAIPREETKGPLEIEPSIKGKYQWLGTRTLAFIPDDALQPATEFKVTLKKGKIQSLTRMQSERDTSWTFESIRPTLLSSAPYQGSRFLDVKSNIYLYFNMEMSPERVQDRIKIYYTQGMPSEVYCGIIKPKSPRFRGEIPFTVRQLKDDEKEDWPLENWENKRTLVIVPKGAMPVESHIEVYLYPGLLAKFGNLGLKDDRIISFNTYNFFSLLNHNTSISGDGGLELCFSNRVKMRELINNLTIEPNVEIPREYQEGEWDANHIHLYLPFKLNTEHKIKVSKKLKDIYNNTLDKDFNFVLRVGDYLSHVEIPTGISIVESKSDLRFPSTFVNVDSVYLQLGVVDLEHAIRFLNASDLFYSFKKYVPAVSGFFNVNRFWSVNTYKEFRNRQIRLPIELSEVLGEKKHGLIFVQLDNLGQERYNPKSRYLKAFLEVCDLGVTWKYAPENNIVWVTSLNDAKPIKEAKVQIRDNENYILWQGLTDGQGLCELPGWALSKLKMEERMYEYDTDYEEYYFSAYYEPKLWLTVLKGLDQAIYSNQWNFGIDPWRFDIAYNWNIRPEEYDCYIFTEKGLYRSGEDVHLKGILRKKKKGQWVLPDINNLILIIRNSRDEEIIHDTLTINRFGSFTRNVQLSEDAPTGVYSVKVILPKKNYNFYHSFRVEAYRPAEFEVLIDAEKDTFIADETFRGTITGRYLFGMPMKDAEISWNLRRGYYDITYSQHAGFRFGEYIEGRERELLGSGTGKLNDKGVYEVSLKLSKKDIYAPSLISLEGIVVAPNKMSISKEQNWIALNADFLIGLKTSKYVYIQGDTIDLNLITVTPSGEYVGDKKISIEIVKQEWKSIKKARLGGRYEWISEVVEKQISQQRVVSKKEPIIVNVMPETPGYYYARALSKDKKGRTSSTKIYFYVAGQGYAGWEMRDDDIIELVADKEKYEAGDTAKILVKSPYDSANCLVTVERELVLRKFIKKVTGNADYIELPIDADYLPNVYVCVTLLRGRVRELSWDEEKEQDLGKPQFKIGYVNINVDKKEKHLKVRTWSDKTDYRPRDSVVVDLEVKDHKGSVVPNSEVALFVVDLGVLNLINFRTPDPFSHFYGSRPLSVKTIESRLNILGERSYGEKGEERGGGGALAEGISYREKFIATVFYKAAIRTDKNGRATTKFVLPDNLTKFRIMAIAQTTGSQFGSAESTFVVSLPFILTPSVPRFARVGDEFVAGVVLHNRTEQKERAEVECRSKGIRLADQAKKAIDLPPNSSKEVLFSFVAENMGEAVFEFSATMGREKDALRLRIPIKLPPFIEAVATFSSTADSALEGLFVPSNIYENIGGLEILLSSSILAGLNRGIEYLMDYPYTCMEQRLSRILPLIIGEDLINQFKLAPVRGKALRDTVQVILNEVGEYQLYNGGFVYFKDGNYPCPYLSAYAMYILHRAKTAGYDINDKMVEKGKAFLKEVLRWQDIDWTYPYNQYAKLTTKSFCLYSLALWNEKENAYATKLFEERNQMPIFGKTLLLKTGRILNMGNGFEDELTRIILNKIKISPTTAHFEESKNRGWTFPAPAKVTAFVIQTFTEMNIPFPYTEQVMRWLITERNKKTKPTTQENAFVFDAFQTYYKKYEKEEPDYVARVILEEKEILAESFKGRTNEPPRRFTFPLSTISKDTLLPLKIIKQGKGRLHYVLRMYYAFKDNPFPFDGGFYVWKEILTLDNKEVKRFKRGEVYKVILHVVVPETRLFAVIEDPLPAGFIPVQTFFETESRGLRERYEEARWEQKGQWWGSFDHEEYYDDKMLMFAQQLFPGEHTRVYFVRAATSGKFLAPQTKAEEMYAPEVFGASTQDYSIIE